VIKGDSPAELPTLGFGAGDENRTRTVSLGICSNYWKPLRSAPLTWAASCPRVTVTDPRSPGLMAR
jgi:hypothetical protein